MSKLEQVSILIENLTPEERAQILAQIVALMNVGELGIRHTPGVCGGRARIRDTRIPVWTIVEAKKSGASDLEILRDFPELNAADLTNAMRYYEGHKSEIEQDLQEQERPSFTEGTEEQLPDTSKKEPHTDLQKKLLDGPVMAEEDYLLYQEKKQHFAQWK